MNERVKELRKALELTQSEFGEKIGITAATISDIERGKLILSNRNISLICERLHVREDWIRTGAGELFAYETLSPEALVTTLGKMDQVDTERINDLLVKYAKLSAGNKKIVNDFIDLFLGKDM